MRKHLIGSSLVLLGLVGLTHSSDNFTLFASLVLFVLGLLIVATGYVEM